MPGDELTRLAVFGVPRSGTSWIGEILNSSPRTVYRFQPLFSYALKDFLTPASTKEDIDAFFEALVDTEDDFINQTARRRSGEFPTFPKTRPTHIVFKEVRYVNIVNNLMRRSGDVRLCAVIRNPLSVINSWLRAPREFRRDLGWTELDEWRYALRKNLNNPEEFNGYEKWKQAANVFLHLKGRYPSRVHVAKYASFLSRPVEETRKLFDHVGLAMTDSTLEFLRESTTTPGSGPYGVFRADQRDDQWKEALDPRITREIIEDLEGTPLEEYIEK